MPYAPTDGLPQRWTADSAKAGLTIPYLGPEPPPSKISGLALIGASGTGAVFFLIRAGLYLHLAALERTFLDRRTPSTLADVQSTTRLVSSLGSIVLLLVGLTLLVDLIWRYQRRPKKARTELGEAYVEFPLKWVTPVALRAIWVGLALGSILLGQAGSIHPTTLAADYPGHRQMTALGSVGWAVLWVSLGVWVVLVNRSHARRLAFSLPYRADASQVPYFPSVAGAVLLETKRTGDRGASGIGWALRTAGLIMLCFIGTGALIGGWAEIGYGHITGWGWLLGGAAMWAFVIWVMVRRYQLGKL